MVQVCLHHLRSDVPLLPHSRGTAKATVVEHTVMAVLLLPAVLLVAVMLLLPPVRLDIGHVVALLPLVLGPRPSSKTVLHALMLRVVGKGSRPKTDMTTMFQGDCDTFMIST